MRPALLLEPVGEDEVVAAHDLATGKAAWERRYPAPYTMNPAAESHGKGPKSTPLVTRSSSRCCSAWSCASA